MLLVEDDRDVAEMFALQFRLDGHDVLIAHDGETAIDLSALPAIDLILLDLCLPKCDGVAVLRTVRARPETRRTPVVILSNSSESALIEECLELGIHGLLVKSDITPGMLSARLRRWTT